MKGPIFNIEGSGKNAPKKPEGEAARIFEANKDYFTNRTKHSNLEVFPAMEAGLNTSAIDLSDTKHPKIYLHDDFLEEKSGGDPMVGLWAASHECKHLEELLGLLRDKDGTQIWERRKEAEKQDPSLHILDNCLDDVKMNKAVVADAPIVRGSFHKVYEKKLFQNTDRTSDPKHLQFAYALLNEDPINGGREFKVDPDVRAEITRLRDMKNKDGQKLFDFMTHPEVSMKDRLTLQELFFEPAYKKFKKDDDDNWKPPETENEGEGKEGKGSKSESQENKKEKGKNKDKKGGGNDGEPADEKDGNESEGAGDNVNKKYEDLYKKFDEEMKKAVPVGNEQKAVEEYIEKKSDKKNYEEESLEAYAKAEDVTVQDLKSYRRYIDRIENLRNPETDELLIEEIRNIFRRIIAERTAKLPQSKMPQSEGMMLRFPSRAVTETKSGNLEPEVWETIEQKEAVKELVGKFDVTLVCDRSGSMGSGGKLEAQRTTAALVLEALREFTVDLEDAAPDLEYNLSVRTEVWSFGDDAQCELLKGLSETLSEKERVVVYQKLSQTPGGATKDYKTLEKLSESLDPKDLEEIAEKKLRKIVFVISDGDSSDAAKTQKLLTMLRGKGILVYGIGVTDEAKSIKTTYAPDAEVCQDQNQLPVVIGELLKEQLEKV